jgi:hypothetical protein
MVDAAVVTGAAVRITGRVWIGVDAGAAVLPHAVVRARTIARAAVLTRR